MPCRFQSTRPRGARHITAVDADVPLNFNPRARVGRDLPPSARPHPTADFNPRARVGRDYEPREIVLQRVISIHAPAWGATRDRRDGGTRLRISIHAPAWGATLRPQEHEPCRRISIHAPAWGATTRSSHERRRRIFQSTRPRGARRRIHHVIMQPVGFQSTRPRGARPRRPILSSGTCDFNPRARVGRDSR